MYTKVLTLAFALLACSSPRFTARATPARGEESTAVAFVNVNVLPMDRESVLEHQTVIVRDERIAEIGAADDIPVPKGAVRIDGRGKYLMPGLTDMHVHLRSPREFPLYLANGVTTVFNLWGRPAHVYWRDQVARGEMPGPAIYTCGPIIFRCDSAEEARRIVIEQRRAGYDSIKIYNDVSAEAYPVLVETARQQKLLVVGHIPRAPGFENVLKAHQAIAHLEEYIYTFFHDNVDDESRIPEAVKATRDAGVPVILTLVNFDHILRQSEDLPAFLARPETRYIAPWTRESWSPGRNYYEPRFKSADKQEYLRKALAFQKKLTGELNRAGVPVLVGTDAMNPGVVPGFSVHEELGNLIECGFTPFEALRSATRYPAEFLSPTADFGTVAAGKRADLLLLEENPLSGLTNLARRVGVMARGRWLPEATLKKMLADVPKDYANGERVVKSSLQREPGEAFEYLSDHDPFNDLAIYVACDLIAEKGFAQFKKLYERTKLDQPTSILVQEWFLNDTGLRLLQFDRKSAAIEIFQLNTEEYPRSAKACDSLAEAYLKNGDKELAIRFYRKALELDPKFASAVEALKKLGP